MSYRRFLLIALLLLSVHSVSAQCFRIDKKYGAVSSTELELKQWPLDTTASAVILYRYIDYNIALVDDLGFVFTKKVRERIKVLKPEGRNRGDYEVFYNTDKALGESVSGIRVTTYNLENGSVALTKMSREFIFKEDYTDNLKRVAFSAQNVRVGSVIETEYTKRSFSWDLDNIYFQFDIPVNCAGAEVNIPEYMKFNRITLGSDNVETKRDIRNGNGYAVYLDRFAVKDVPALRKEYYSYNVDQYRTGVRYEIRSFEAPGYYKEYTANWNNIDEEVRKTAIVRGLKAGPPFKEEIVAAASTASDDLSRIVAVRNCVASKVGWDGKVKLIPGKVSEVIRAGAGNSADLNVLVGSALRHLGYKVEPVLIRGRSKGYIVDYYVAFDTYNRSVLRIESQDGGVWFMDACQEHGYPNVLPDECLVERARLLHTNGGGEWIDLRALCRSQIVDAVTAEVSVSGLLSGTVSEKFFNESSFSKKQSYRSFSDEESFIESLEEKYGMDILSFNAVGMKEYSPEASLDFSFEKQMSVSSGHIYINPFLLNLHGAATFREEERHVPVDFAYPYRLSYSFTLKIPESFEVESVPEQKVLKAAGLNSKLVMQCRQTDENVVRLDYSFSLNSYSAPVEAYRDVRAWWQLLQDVYGTSIVLRRKS